MSGGLLTSMRAFASRVRGWLRPRPVDHDFARELDSHLAMLTEENIRRGMSPAEAVRAARIRLGNSTCLQETNRELRGLPFLEMFLQDARYALRMLRNNPGFTAIAVITLALGIGANTAIFSVVYAVVIKPLPYAHADQLFNVFEQASQDQTIQTGWSYLNFAALRDQNHVFSEVAGTQRHQLTLTGHGEPVLIDTAVVTGNFFALFDAAPLAGRVFSPADGNVGAPPVVILGENLWRLYQPR